MTALLVADWPSIAASVVASALPVPFPVFVPEGELYIDFPDFGCRLAARMTDFGFERESARVTVQAKVNRDVIVTLTLLGALIENFRINEELFIDDAVIEDLAAVRKELGRNDGHLVEVMIRPLSGTGRVVLQNAPKLPESAWDPSIQALIDLEPHLDASLADRYNALAASTLCDLTEEEKREVTARPKLDEAAFRLNDSYGESL